MRRLMFLLSLIAVLSGTHLRLAEAAEDLGRSLAELNHGVNLEEVDGGVGDDSGATIKSDVAQCLSTSVSVDLPLALPHCLAFQAERADPGTVGPLHFHDCCTAQRRAWLQRFLC